MIDWVSVGYSSLWIFGLSLVLAALSFADYRAHVERGRFRRILSRPGFQSVVNLGLMLVCLGLVGSARAGWERAVWALLAIAFGIQTWQAYKSYRRMPDHV